MATVSRKIETFADLLARRIADAGETPATMAPKLGVSFQTVYLWLDGSHLPPRTRFAMLAAVLGTTVSRLGKLVEHDRAARQHAADAASAAPEATATIPHAPVTP